MATAGERSLLNFDTHVVQPSGSPQDPCTLACVSWCSSRTLPPLHCRPLTGSPPARCRRPLPHQPLCCRRGCRSLEDEGLLRCERARGARRLRPQAPHSCLCPAVGLPSFRRCGPVSHPRPVLQRGWGRGAHAGASEAGRLRDGFGRRRVVCEQLRVCQATIQIDARMVSRAAPRGRPSARGGCGITSSHPLAFIGRMAFITGDQTRRTADVWLKLKPALTLERPSASAAAPAAHHHGPAVRLATAETCARVPRARSRVQDRKHIQSTEHRPLASEDTGLGRRPRTQGTVWSFGVPTNKPFCKKS